MEQGSLPPQAPEPSRGDVDDLIFSDPAPPSSER